MKTNENGIYDARTLGLPKMLILGLQHMFAMFGATILVPGSGKHLFPRRRLIHSGNTVLRRNRNSAVPLNDTF